MKIACLTMIRNEQNLIQPFLDQAQEFFDYTYFIDHSSSDQTLNLIRNRRDPSFSIFHLQAYNHPQSEICNEFVHLIQQRHDVDHIILLDADEFIPFTDRASFEKFLYQRQHAHAITWHWRNILPKNIENPSPYFEKSFLFSPNIKSKSTKTILNKKIFNHKDWRLPQGNHYIDTQNKEIFTYEEINFELFHIPIQSKINFLKKLISGALRLTADKDKKNQGLGYHWVNLNKYISRIGINTSIACSVCFDYPNIISNYETRELNFTFPYISPTKHIPLHQTNEDILLTLMHQASELEKGDFPINLHEENCTLYLEEERINFNPTNYLLNNFDVLLSRFDPFFHYIKWGKNEGRSYNA